MPETLLERSSRFIDEIYGMRRAEELSLLSKGIFGSAAAASEEKSNV